MENNYKELYFFLFNRITDMIHELQSLQQQAEEAFMTGCEHIPLQTQEHAPICPDISHAAPFAYDSKELANTRKDRAHLAYTRVQGNVPHGAHAVLPFERRAAAHAAPTQQKMIRPAAE